MVQTATIEVIRGLNERQASFGRRLAAQVIDALVVAVLSVLVGVVVSDKGVANVVFLILAALYYVVLEGRYEQTVGKRVLGIRVVDDSTGARIGVGVAVVVAYLIGWALIATRGSGPSSGR
jgi:uncharacterized RDD family membrane protein YckC